MESITRFLPPGWQLLPARPRGLVRHVADFAHFLEAISFSYVAQLNLASVAPECGVERKTVAGFVEVLEEFLRRMMPGSPVTKAARVRPEGR